MGRYQSGQLGQTVNLLSYDFVGSNPALPTTGNTKFQHPKSKKDNLEFVICYLGF